MLLLSADLDPGPRYHPIQRTMAQLAIPPRSGDSKIHVPAGGVCVPVCDKRADDLDDVRNFLGDPGVDPGPLDVEGLHARHELLDVPFRQLPRIYAFLLRPLDDLVVHVGEILHVVYLVPKVLKVAPQNVEDHVAHGVSQMAWSIGCDAAHVYLYLIPGGNELLLLSGQRVIQPHRASSNSATA